jgi:hypothetical protein
MAVLDVIRRALRRRRVELQGADPYTWRRIIRRARLGSTATLVAAILADYASPDGRHVRPGNDRLAAETELSDKSIRRAMDKLRDIGLIERVFAGSRMGRRALADEYRLTIPDDLAARVELLEPDTLQTSPVSVTGDPAGDPVDNPETPVTDTGDPAPPDPGTPVTDAGTPVTESRNTGHSDRPPNQAPNHKTPTNKPTGRADHNLSWKTQTIIVRTSELDDLASDDELTAYNGAQAILSRLDDFGTELQELAEQTLTDPNIRQLAIAAARMLVNGVPA